MNLLYARESKSRNSQLEASDPDAYCVCTYVGSSIENSRLKPGTLSSEKNTALQYNQIAVKDTRCSLCSREHDGKNPEFKAA